MALANALQLRDAANQLAAMMTTGRRAAVGGPPFPPPPVANAASISGPEHTERVGAPAGDYGVVPGSAERAEEGTYASSSASLLKNCQPHL